MAKNILVIDDDKIVLRTIEKLLTKEGYCLTILDSGQKALEAIKGTFYDLKDSRQFTLPYYYQQVTQQIRLFHKDIYVRFTHLLRLLR